MNAPFARAVLGSAEVHMLSVYFQIYFMHAYFSRVRADSELPVNFNARVSSHESLPVNHCSSRRIALTPATYFRTDSLFPTLRSRWCASENALASPLVLLLAGCASYLPHLYPVQLSYALALLNICISASVWNRTITHRKYQYVLTHECLRTMTRSFEFLCVGACTDTVLQVHANAKASL